MNNIDKQKLMDEIIASSGGKIGRKDLDGAVKSNNIASLLQNLSAEDKQKLSAVMSDKANLSAVLSSPEAKAILKSFLKGGGKNG